MKKGNAADMSAAIKGGFGAVAEVGHICLWNRLDVLKLCSVSRSPVFDRPSAISHE